MIKILMLGLAMSVTCLWDGCGRVIASEKKILAIDSNPPFTKVYNDKVVGLDIDLFRAIANDNGWEMEIKVFPTVKDVLQSVRSGESDFGMTGITINSEREASGITFSQPYFIDGGIQIMTHVDNAKLSLLEKFTIAWPTIKRMMVMLFVIVSILAHVIWFKEGFRKNDSNFDRNYFKGVFQAYYWAIVTSSTVGYGDITAKTVTGRFLSIVAIIVGLTWFADFMSDMSAVKAIIANQKANMELTDLNGEKVATILNSTAHKMLEEQYPSIEVVPFVDITEACNAVVDKKVHSVVFDAPAVQYFADSNDSVCLAGDIFVKEQYGIAMKDGSADVKTINCSLLKFKENGLYDTIKHKWLK